MKKTQKQFFEMKFSMAVSSMKLYLLLTIGLWTTQVHSQCTNTTPFGSEIINPSGTLTIISGCSFAGEYATVSGASAGQTLEFTSSVPADFITVHSGSANGPVLAFGQTPLVFANTFTGTLFAHWNTDVACGLESVCRTTTVQCLSCLIVPTPCNFTSAFETAAINNTGALVPISSC